MEQEMYINGIGTTYYDSTVEYVAAPVTAAYMSNMQDLQSILNNTNDVNGAYDKILQDLQNLANLAQNGAQDVNGYSYYMTQQMADELSSVVQSLNAVGIPSSTFLTNSPADTATKNQLVQNWQSLGGFGISALLTQAVNVYTDPHTLQSMIELEYVKAGNSAISTQLGLLESALTTTSNILSTLTILENISNHLSTSNDVTPFVFPPTNNGNLSVNAISALINQNTGLYGSRDVVGWNAFIGAVDPGYFAYYNSLGIVNNTPTAAQMALLQTKADDYLKGYLSTTTSYHGFTNTGNTSDPSNIYTVFPGNSVFDMYLHDQLAAGAHVKLDANGIMSILNIGSGNPANQFSNNVADILNTSTLKNGSASFTSLSGFSSMLLAQDINNPASPNDYEIAYRVAASAHFTQVLPYAQTQATDGAQLIQAYHALIAECQTLSAQGTSVSTVNSLTNLVYNAASTIAANFTVAGLLLSSTAPQSQLNSAASKWILDNQNQLTTTSNLSQAAGGNQNAITLAIQSAQSLNDTQKQDVQNYLFIFQEFYKSASTVLQNISQIIQTMAQGINH